MFSIHTILHPTDFSAPSEPALRLAGTLASDYGAHLVILHVIRTPLALSDGVIFPELDDGHDELRDKLDRLEIPEDNVGVIRRLEEGNPAAEILQAARLCRADLIVMGSHGRRGWGRLLLGSVTDEVVRQATCPVLTVTMHAGAPTPRRNEDVLQTTFA